MRSLLRPVLVLLSGSAAAQLITLLISPILSRIYSPDDFGLLAVYGSLVTIFGGVANLRLDLAVTVPKDDAEAAPIMRSAFTVAACIGGGLVLLALVFGRPIAGLLGQPAIAPYLPLVGIAVFSIGVFQTALQWHARMDQFKRVATAQLGRSITTNALQLAGSAFGAFGGFMVIGQFLGQLAASTRLALRREVLVNLRPASRKEFRSVMSQYRDFAMFGAPQTMLNAVSQSLPSLLFTAFLSPAAAGLYALTQRVLAAPARLVGESVRQALYPRLARSMHGGQTLKLALRMTGLMAALVVLPIVLITLAGPWLFSTLFGEQWLDAGRMARYLIFAPAMGFLNIPASCLVQLLRLQRFHMFYEMFYIAVRASALVYGSLRGDAMLAVGLYAAAGVLFNLILISTPMVLLARGRSGDPTEPAA